jgi:hypothetical protein
MKRRLGSKTLQILGNTFSLTLVSFFAVIPSKAVKHPGNPLSIAYADNLGRYPIYLQTVFWAANLAAQYLQDTDERFPS